MTEFVSVEILRVVFLTDTDCTETVKLVVQENRHVLLWLDQAPGHDFSLRFSFVKLMTLLKNKTSILQPCDQGAIAYVKSKFEQWSNLSLFEDSTNNTIQKIEKITTIIENMPSNIIKDYTKKVIYDIILLKNEVNCAF